MDANGKLFQIVLQGWALIRHWPHYIETGHPHPHHPLTPITNTWNKSKQGSAEGNWMKYRGSMREKVRKKWEGGDLRILMQTNKGLYKLKWKQEGKRGQLLEGGGVCGRCVCTVENLGRKNWEGQLKEPLSVAGSSHPCEWCLRAGQLEAADWMRSHVSQTSCVQLPCPWPWMTRAKINGYAGGSEKCLECVAITAGFS